MIALSWRFYEVILMKGFKLTAEGDLSLTDGKIDMIDGIDLTAQTVKTVTSTNKGEWWLNENEGIQFFYILGKGVTEDVVRSECQNAARQVDMNLQIDEFDYTVNPVTRKAKVKYTIIADNGEAISSENSWDLGGVIE